MDADQLILNVSKNSTNQLKITGKERYGDEDKLELLCGIETQFTFAGQDRIPVNDIKSRFMKGKKGNFMVAYNIQSAVDYDTKLICTINVAQNPHRPLRTTNNRRKSNKKHLNHIKIHKCRYNILKPNITIMLIR